MSEFLNVLGLEPEQVNARLAGYNFGLYYMENKGNQRSTNYAIARQALVGNDEATAAASLKGYILAQMEGKKETIESAHRNVLTEIKQANEEKKEALKQGDTSENAEYQNALDKIAKLRVQEHNLAKQLEAYSGMEFDYELKEDNNYQRIEVGSIVLLSMVEGTNIGDNFIFLLVPSLLSDMQANTLSIESPVGSRLLGKQAQSTITLTIKGIHIKYLIQEVF